MSRCLLGASVLAAALGLVSGCDSGGGGTQTKSPAQLQTDATKGASGQQDMMKNQPTSMPGASDAEKEKMQKMMQQAPGPGGAGLAPQGGAPGAPPK